MLPSIDEIVEEREESEVEKVYTDYLERLEMSRLSTEAAFDFIRNCLISLTANTANTAMIYVCIDFGMHWLSASMFGFGLGLIPVAYHLNNAGIDLSSEFKVKKIGALIVAGGCLVAAFNVSYQSGGEKRTLIDFTNKGLMESSREVANYEVKFSPWDGVNFWFSYHSMQAVGSGLIPALLGAIAMKYLRGRR
ncbi:MAG: hypothetical protein KME54_17715 [Tolypothrix brevis GSE-NOS-MK-07-07A]|jgi:hypothetical protein|nr:hypothetical protein [Tolypothrix brevis GSE-NOS-MK-07-07A]